MTRIVPLSPVVEYHGLGRRYLPPLGLLMRPQLNGGTLDGREAACGAGRATPPASCVTICRMRVTPFLALTLLLGGGCGGHDCTDMGCVQGVTMEFASPLAETGEYVFTLTKGTHTDTCSAFVPLRRDGTEPTCEGMLINRQEVTTRTEDGIQGTAGNAIASVWVGGEHDALSLTVTRDRTEILRADLTPTYRGIEINGEGCGECPMATHTVGG